MASKNLATNLAGGEPGHPDIHNDLAEVANFLDYDAMLGATAGQVLKVQTDGLLAPDTDLTGATGASGFAEMGVRYVDPTQVDNSGDGRSPATAKRDIAAAADSLPGAGGTVLLASHAAHVINATVSTDQKPVYFQGMGQFATQVLLGSSLVGPGFLLNTQRGSGVSRLRFDAQDKARIGIGAIKVNGKSAIIRDCLFWQIGSSVGGSYEAEDPDAPYDIYAERFFLNSNWQMSDWIHISGNYHFEPYRAVVLQPGVNGTLHSSWFTRPVAGASLYLRRSNEDGGNCNISASDCHLVMGNQPAGGSVRDHDYLVYYWANPASAGTAHEFYGKARFANFRTESFGTTGAHWFVNTTMNVWVNLDFEDQGTRMEFGAQGNSPDNVIGPVVARASAGGYVNADQVTFMATKSGP